MFKLDPAVTYSFVPPDRLVFTTPNGCFTILDKAGLVRDVLECLESARPIEKAFLRIPDAGDRKAICEGILAALKARRILCEKTEPHNAENTETDKDLLRVWLRFAGVQTGQIGPIGIIGDESLAALVLREVEALGLNGQTINTVRPDFDLIVLCQDNPDIAQMRDANRQSVRLDIPFFPISVDRHIVSLGPVVIPGATACMECLHHRAQMNALEGERPVSSAVKGHKSPVVLRLGAILGAIEIARFLSGAIYDLNVATQVRHSVLTGKRSHSVTLRLPRCPVCGIGAGVRPLVDTFAAAEQSLLEPAE